MASLCLITVVSLSFLHSKLEWTYLHISEIIIPLHATYAIFSSSCMIFVYSPIPATPNTICNVWEYTPYIFTISLGYFVWDLFVNMKRNGINKNTSIKTGFCFFYGVAMLTHSLCNWEIMVLFCEIAAVCQFCMHIQHYKVSIWNKMFYYFVFSYFRIVTGDFVINKCIVALFGSKYNIDYIGYKINLLILLLCIMYLFWGFRKISINKGKCLITVIFMIMTLAGIGYIKNSFDVYKPASDEVESERASFDLELLSYLVPTNRLPQYKQAYDEIKHAIDSHPPERRDVYKSRQIVSVKMCELDKLISVLIDKVKRDLDITVLEHELSQKIKDMHSYAQLGISKNKKKYVKINLDHTEGGRSKILAGGLGYSRIDGEITFAIILYSEIWKQHDWVKLKKNSNILTEKNIEMFAMYLLYKNEVGLPEEFD
eukprot:721_1